MPTHSHQRTNHQRDTYSQICLGHRSVNVTQQAYSCLAPCNKPGRCRADLLVSLLRSSFLYLYSVFAIEIQFDPAVSGWCRLVGCTWIRNQTRSATLDQERVSACRWTSGTARRSFQKSVHNTRHRRLTRSPASCQAGTPKPRQASRSDHPRAIAQPLPPVAIPKYATEPEIGARSQMEPSYANAPGCTSRATALPGPCPGRARQLPGQVADAPLPDSHRYMFTARAKG
jgi:hypothetical protein